MSGLVVNQRWRPLTGGRYEIMYISARIHDSNEIPTVTPMFPGSGNTDRLLGILSYVCSLQSLFEKTHSQRILNFITDTGICMTF